MTRTVVETCGVVTMATGFWLIHNQVNKATVYVYVCVCVCALLLAA